MTQKEKDLLLKDLCARLPYELKYNFGGNDGFDYTIDRVSLIAVDDTFPIKEVKPYLRPMSSMTEEEKDELYTAMDWYGEIDESGNVYTKGQEKVYRETFYEYTDWLNAHHFDYRGLIEKGLALEAPKDMYKTK